MTLTITRPARIRFNQGYHDGALSKRKGFPQPWGEGKTHPDKVYQSGYNAGFAAEKTGQYVTDSTAAWAVYNA